MSKQKHTDLDALNQRFEARLNKTAFYSSRAMLAGGVILSIGAIMFELSVDPFAIMLWIGVLILAGSYLVNTLVVVFWIFEKVIHRAETGLWRKKRKS